MKMSLMKMSLMKMENRMTPNWISRTLLAAANSLKRGDKVDMVAMTSSLTLLAAAKDGDGEDGPRRFQMDAYNGGLMEFYWSEDPVVVDLKGVSHNKSIPILLDHSPRDIVGHADDISNDGKALAASGIISGAGSAAQEVVASSDAGFPWQASIGARILETERVPKGQKVQVNGRGFEGPLLIIRKSKLAEASFVPLGADDSTSANMAAHQTNLLGGVDMDFTEWLKAQGFDVDTLTDAQKQTLRAAFDAQNSGDPNGDPIGDSNTIIANYRQEMASEAKRIATIQRLCAGNSDMAIQAIDEGWDATKVELEVLRASRSAPNIIRGSGSAPAGCDVLEAAAIQSMGIDGSEMFKDEILQAAHQRYHGRISLQELLLEAAWANGYSGHNFRGDMRGVLEAAFSSRDISGILSNIANKSMLAAFLAVEQTWRTIADISAVSDFKTHTRYRLIGTDQYEIIRPGGEIEHGTLGEDSTTIKADTYAKMFGITRQDMINDDLGILQLIPRKLGRGAGTKLNELFWTTFLDNAAFFTSGNKNYIEGAATKLSLDGLSAADEKLRDQVDHEGNPLGISGQILLVPNALRITAMQLINSTEVRNPSAKEPTGNPFAGQLSVVSSAYLGNATYTGASTKAWYLLTNPADLATIEVAFLNGQQSPVIESADADFNRLGIQMRGYHDFGVSRQEFRAGVKSKGEA
jgi:hypothetical protein